MIDSLAEVNGAFPWFFSLMVFVFGACIGSFLNVVIYRLPRGSSVVRPGSHCVCGQPIAWHDNLPILSWIMRRGRARCCGRRFSVRYPIVELLTALLFLAAWSAHSPLVALAVMVFIGWMIAPSFIDLDTMEIPDLFSIGGFGLGLLIALLVPALHGHVGDLWLVDAFRALTDSLQGALIGSGLILWIALVAEAALRKEAMGFGDVKLMGAIGAFCGWEGAVFAIFGGAVLGCIGFALALPFAKRTPLSAMPDAETASSPITNHPEAVESEAGTRIPFGPALAGAAVLYLLWLHPWVDAYFDHTRALLFPASLGTPW